jgi:phenylpyruvate tautomerase PptA (4-oxalocrotonate tautomerase family)
MPRLELTITEGALSKEAKAELPAKLASTLLQWEGAPDTAFFRSISWAHLLELPAETIQTPDGVAEPHAVVDVTVPEGALSERRRAGLIEDATKQVLEATGWGDDAGVPVWVLVHEVTDGFWGAAGQVVRFEQLRAAAKAERDGGDGAAAVGVAREEANA